MHQWCRRPLAIEGLTQAHLGRRQGETWWRWRLPTALLALDLRLSQALPFSLSEAETACIHAAFDQAGEFAAALELRRLCPGITDLAQARRCAHIIVSWRPVPVTPQPECRTA